MLGVRACLYVLVVIIALVLIISPEKILKRMDSTLFLFFFLYFRHTN